MHSSPTKSTNTYSTRNQKCIVYSLTYLYLLNQRKKPKTFRRTGASSLFTFRNVLFVACITSSLHQNTRFRIGNPAECSINLDFQFVFGFGHVTGSRSNPYKWFLYHAVRQMKWFIGRIIESMKLRLTHQFQNWNFWANFRGRSSTRKIKYKGKVDT